MHRIGSNGGGGRTEQIERCHQIDQLRAGLSKEAWLGFGFSLQWALWLNWRIWMMDGDGGSWLFCEFCRLGFGKG